MSLRTVFQRAPLLLPAVSLMAGIVFATKGSVAVPWLPLLLVLVVVGLLSGRWPRLQTAVLVLCFMAIGGLRSSTDSGNGMPSIIQRAEAQALSLRQQLLQRYQQPSVTPDVYAVVAAMTLGDKSALTPQLKERYNLTGASHVLALSGLHLGIICSLLVLLMGGRRGLLPTVVLVLCLWAFVFLVGLPLSVIRSATMLSIYALMSVGFRTQAPINTLAFTAMAMLFISPSALYDVGFQLSFMAVLCILLFMPLFMSVFTAEFLQTHRLIKWLYGMAAVSLSAQLGTAPLVAFYFGRFPTWFLLTNFVVIPLVTLILYLALASLLIPLLMPLLAGCVRALNAALAWLALLPYSSIEGLHPNVAQVALVYVLIACAYVALWVLCKRYFSKCW